MVTEAQEFLPLLLLDSLVPFVCEGSAKMVLETNNMIMMDGQFFSLLSLL